MFLADEKFKNVDKTYWENMIKEADKNNDGEVAKIFEFSLFSLNF